MTTEQKFVTETHLVTPGNRLLIARVTLDWQIEVGNELDGYKIDEIYGTEEVICFSALASRVNLPTRPDEVLKEALAIKNDPLVDCTNNSQIFQVENPISLVKEALKKLTNNTEGSLQPFVFKLGKHPLHEFMLVDNLFDSEYGLRKLREHFENNPDKAHLKHIYLATFVRAMTRGIPRKKSSPNKPTGQETSDEKIIIPTPEELQVILDAIDSGRSEPKSRITDPPLKPITSISTPSTQPSQKRVTPDQVKSTHDCLVDSMPVGVDFTLSLMAGPNSTALQKADLEVALRNRIVTGEFEVFKKYGKTTYRKKLK